MCKSTPQPVLPPYIKSKVLYKIYHYKNDSCSNYYLTEDKLEVFVEEKMKSTFDTIKEVLKNIAFPEIWVYYRDRRDFVYWFYSNYKQLVKDIVT